MTDGAKWRRDDLSEEPGAGNPLARICAGGGPQGPSLPRPSSTRHSKRNMSIKNYLIDGVSRAGKTTVSTNYSGAAHPPAGRALVAGHPLYRHTSISAMAISTNSA